MIIATRLFIGHENIILFRNSKSNTKSMTISCSVSGHGLFTKNRDKTCS